MVGNTWWPPQSHVHVHKPIWEHWVLRRPWEKKDGWKLWTTQHFWAYYCQFGMLMHFHYSVNPIRTPFVLVHSPMFSNHVWRWWKWWNLDGLESTSQCFLQISIPLHWICILHMWMGNLWEFVQTLSFCYPNKYRSYQGKYHKSIVEHGLDLIMEVFKSCLQT